MTVATRRRAAPSPARRCGAVLERLHTRGDDVTTGHLAAVALLRAAWDCGGEPAVQPALRAVGRAGAPLLLWVAIYDRPLSAWCALPRNRQVGRPDPTKQFGRLLASLDLLAAHYSTEVLAQRA